LAYACIDVGTNTTRLLVAEPHAGWLRSLRAERAFTRLGRDLLAEGALAPERIAETAAAVAEQAILAREAGARAIEVVATAAIRDAVNGAELVAAVQATAGLSVRVLSDEEEARLSFDGATRGLELDGSVAVVDVGGGSTELAVGDPGAGVSWFASFRIGSGVLADKYLLSDPPAAAELAAARDHVRATLAGLTPPQADRAIAVGGSATSLRRFVGPTLEPQALARSAELLLVTPIRDAAERFGLDPERVRLLPAGMTILGEVIERLGLPLDVGRGGLREGVILALADRNAG
jgi:exopolyphosphatase/guanosine-5'-triphosphate,3'-diphosphate pyrophosphatase